MGAAAPSSSLPSLAGQCRRIRVRGLVQGVGYRPFVYRLAFELGLSGWVRNDAEGVDIEARGPAPALERFVARLRSEAPSLARVEAVEQRQAASEGGLPGFLILESRGGHASTAIGPDSALCHDCLRELFDPDNRRYRYAFTHCTHCGPRYSITRELPYDRARTALSPFPLCPECGREYGDPANRRFHAEANCCPVCGPRLSLLDARGRPLAGAGLPTAGDDPVLAAVALLKAGKIVAIKGYGGFHLACDAANAAAVAELRRRKQREEKPFALMLANVASVGRLCQLSGDEAGLLELPERSIVLLRRRAQAAPGTAPLAANVAPGLSWLGCMLPYAPLHYLLFHAAAGCPSGLSWLAAPQDLSLVMTSANPGGEPLVTDNARALSRLAGLADAYLLHDRDIVVRADDSVVRHAGGAVQFLRRGRGQTPRPIKLADEGPCVLAFGGFLKNTLCVLKGREAILSQHIGDLGNAATVDYLEQAARHLLHVLDATPAAVAYDLHPDFPSSRLAADFAAARGIPAYPIAHHHAHIAAVLAENGAQAGRSKPVLGLALDGFGLGPAGELWGGELLRVDGAEWQRLAGLTPLALPGGDKAAREPWRLAAAALWRLGRGADIPAFLARRYPDLDPTLAQGIGQMLERGLNCPGTSSLGRLFDGVSGLLGLRAKQSFEAQAAMELEGLADAWLADHGPLPPLPGGWTVDGAGDLDFAPLLAWLAECPDPALGSARFHLTLAAALADWTAAAAAREGLSTVALGGGCLLNHVLSQALVTQLVARGLSVLEARQAPPNDGGLSLGQAWIGRRLLSLGHE